MALDSRLIIASDLQSLFRDKDTGLPLRNGVIAFYEDEARTISKPVYKLSGSPPNYSYVSLGSEITLSSIGTMQDDNTGDDIILYYFPFEGTPEDSDGNVELYYVTVENESGVNQFTREAWPNFINTESSSTDFTNYVPNGQFLFHNDVPLTDTTKDAGEITAPITTVAQGDWTFERPAGSTAKDIVTFEAFNSYVSDPSASPQYRIRIICETPSAGDSYKDLRIKFTDVNKFASTTQKYTFAFTGESNETGSLSVSLILIKNFGTNGSATTETPLGNLVIPAGGYSVAQTTQGFTFGVNTGKTIGADSYLQFAIRFPTDSGFDSSLTNFILTPEAVDIETFPQTTDGDFSNQSLIAGAPNPDGSDLYLPLVSTPSGITYSHSDIGKIFPCVYETPNISELLCDGTKYETAAYSSDGIPYSRLQAVLYNTTLNIPRFGTGQQFLTAYPDPVTSQMIVSTNYPGAATDTSDGTIATGFIFNTIHGGSDYGIQAHLTSNDTVYAINDFIGACAAANPGTTAFGIYTIRTGTALIKQVVTITPVGTVSTFAGTYFTISSTTGNFYVWFKVDGAGSDPAPGGTGIQIDLASTYDLTTVALLIAEALSGHQQTTINFLAGTDVVVGSYFNLYVTAAFNAEYYVWFTKDGIGTDPAPSGKIPIKVAVLSADSDAQVAIKTQHAINSKYFAVPDLRGQFLRGWDDGADVDPESENRWTLNSLIYGDKVGTQQLDDFLSHTHGYLYGNTQQAASGPDEVTPDNFATTTTAAGGFETRPVNTYVNYVIKY
jgi:hypothetical protein